MICARFRSTVCTEERTAGVGGRCVRAVRCLRVLTRRKSTWRRRNTGGGSFQLVLLPQSNGVTSRSPEEEEEDARASQRLERRVTRESSGGVARYCRGRNSRNLSRNPPCPSPVVAWHCRRRRSYCYCCSLLFRRPVRPVTICSSVSWRFARCPGGGEGDGMLSCQQSRQ